MERLVLTDGVAVLLNMVVAGLSSITKVTTLDDQRGRVRLRNRSGDDYCKLLLAKENSLRDCVPWLGGMREKSIITRREAGRECRNGNEGVEELHLGLAVCKRTNSKKVVGT